MFHQMLVKKMVGLQSDNKRNRSNVIATVINHDHLVLKITDVAFKGLSWLHFDGEKVVVLELLPQGVLVEASVANFLKVLKKQ